MPLPSQPRVVKKRATGLLIVTFSHIILTLVACTYLHHALAFARVRVDVLPHHFMPRCWPPHQLPMPKLKKQVNLFYCSSTSLIVLLSVNSAPDECGNTVSDNEDVDIPVPSVPQKQTARKSGKFYWIDRTTDSTHQLQGPDPTVDDEVYDNSWHDNAEQSSVTESDSDIVVVESDDPFFEDPKNNNNRLSKKLDAEVRFSPLPLSTCELLSP